MADETDQYVASDRFAHHIREELEEAAAQPRPDGWTPFRPEDDAEFGTAVVGHKSYKLCLDRRISIYHHVSNGKSIYDACEAVGISYNTYKGYRKRYPEWTAKLDVARLAAAGHLDSNTEIDFTNVAAFCARFFGQPPTWFQLMFLEEMVRTPKGNILMVLWPPEHGKTTTFENYASYKLALSPGFRFLCASENQGIAKKILGRVMNRMDPLGPTQEFVHQFGPFVPQTGGGNSTLRQPWTDTRFRVYGARETDERNYSMEAVGVGGSIVSARCDQLHVDDPQSTKTLSRSESITNWFRQDALSRPAESGITTVCGTRVGDGDFFEELLEDPDLDDILKVIRFPAIITDNETGEQKPLWQKDPEDPEGPGHTLETLDRMRRKAGSDVWDRNWMQNPGLSRKGKGTFTQDVVEKCQDELRSLEHHVGDEGEREDAIVYIGLDPALGSKNCVIACEVLPTPGESNGSKLIVRRIREDIGFERNEQIMSSLESVIRWCNLTGNTTDVVIEDKNFQLGLKNDERMEAMSKRYGFQLRGHTTGWSKYDPDIGIASMASSFIRGEIILPWADDSLTQHEIGELKRQLYAWKPGARGNKLRQDRVMALWFVWMLWQSRRKSLEGVGSTSGDGWKRQTSGWVMNDRGIVVPNRGAA